MLNKKRALVLSGGGNRGAYEVGVLKHLILNKNRRYDTIIGVSVGALNASFLSQYNKNEQDIAIKNLENLWKNIKKEDVYSFWNNSIVSSAILSLFGIKPSLLDLSPLSRLIDKNFHRNFHESDTELLIGVTELATGRFIVKDKMNPKLKTFISASCSIPVIFAPIEIDGIQYVDGGIRSNTPLKAILETGEYDVVDVIVLVPKEEELEMSPGELRTIYGIAYRTLEILAHKILYSEVNVINTRDMFKEIQTETKELDIDLKINIISPKVNLLSLTNFSSVLNFNKNLIQKFIDLGYENAKETIK